ncbi:MAG TPA: lipoprotein insertase outer membrane protein LolB [Xanthomonadales bacterium]|nr:lipoprotein insertase outer membrane protein LolB [Xanthomonadales bacterium]
MSSELRQTTSPLLAALLLCALAACSTVPPLDEEQAARRPLYEQRLARLGPLEGWMLEGRLAVSDDRDGGSGYLNWRQESGASRMDFHGALGRGAWRLETGRDGAELEFADGRVFRADSIDALLRSQVGWQVPVDKLSWWIRGLAAPGKVERSALDEAGRLSRLEQFGWSIEYGRYGPVGAESMPVKMTARQADRTVKLAVRKWDLQGGQQQQQ